MKGARITWGRLKAALMLMALAYGENCQLQAATQPPWLEHTRSDVARAIANSVESGRLK